MSLHEDMDQNAAGEPGDTLAFSAHLEQFKEVEEVKMIISNLTNICGKQISMELTHERMQVIFDQYQEQSHLLDQHLDSLLSSLLDIVRSVDVHIKVSHFAFKLIYLITKTRGYKVIIRHLPHEVSDLEPVLALLSKQTANDFDNWETRYVLLLWLSIVCMIPFDMSRLDSNIASPDTGEIRLPIMQRIMDAGIKYLSVSDKSRDAAAFILSRFMTRPDVKVNKLPEFLNWCLHSFHTTDIETMTGMTSLSGVLSTLALLFKHGKRQDLISSAGTVFDQLVKLNLKDSGNVVLRKLSIKLIQRLGLTFLKAKVATWRYQRGNRCLAHNLSQTKTDGTDQQMMLKDEDEDEQYDIADEVETIIEELLNGLKDKDTVVRWSAAKGIGRVTSRLPQDLADEVVGALMQLFTITETDGAWHGGCLALAELGRRGLLLPQRLTDVVPVIIRALSYDERRGNFSVGAHVRDAACYVCWAFARAYQPEQMKPYVHDIANALVIVSVFDREVNVRRAASAAFQENVGRQGQFSHGIDILTTCDYFAVGNRKHCYLDLSVFVAQYEEYKYVLIEHLLNNKSVHWDGAIRQLSAEAMHCLTTTAPNFMASEVLPQLIKKCSNIDLNVRHGSILCAAYVSHALAQIASSDNKTISHLLDESTIEGLRDIAPKLDEAKMFRGLGGELMKKAVFCLIQKLSLAKMPFHGHQIIDCWRRFIDSCLQHDDLGIQTAALNALPAFVSEYYLQEDGTVNKAVQENLLSSYMAHLASSLETVRCGFSLALGVLPAALLQGYQTSVLSSLLAATRITSKDAKWVSARRDAVIAITNLCQTVGVSCDGSHDQFTSSHIDEIYDAFFIAMTDYTLDSRGDEGAGVREASMRGLHQITELLVNTENAHLISPEKCKKLFCCLVQQASEKIDRTRTLAGQIFCKLLHHNPPVPHIPHRDKLIEIFPKSEVEHISWAMPSDSFSRFTPLLALSTYTYSVLLGLTVSVGGLTESLVKYSSSSLFEYERKIANDVQKIEAFSQVILQIFTDYQKVDRVSLCMMKMLDQLLTRGCFSQFTDDEKHNFPRSLLRLTKEEVSRCGDLQKILASIDVFCGLLQFPGEVQVRTLVQLCIMLCHKYPIVRRTTANKLYTSVVTYDGLVCEDKLEEVLGILSDTQWDQPVSAVRPVRNQLCDLMEIARPVSTTSSVHDVNTCKQTEK